MFPAYSHSTSGIFIVERLSESFKPPRGFHLKTHGNVARVQQRLHEQWIAPLWRLPFNELQVADTLDGPSRRQQARRRQHSVSTNAQSTERVVPATARCGRHGVLRGFSTAEVASYPLPDPAYHEKETIPHNVDRSNSKLLL